MNERQEKTIICKDCGQEFTLTVGEQDFYKEKGFAEPVRCKDCRNKRKVEREQNQVIEKTEEEKNNDFEEMLKRFQENTVKFDDIEKRDRKRRK